MADNAARLHRLVAHRELLRARFHSAWRSLPQSDPDALEDWASAAVELIEVNAGPACQLAFWKASASLQAPLHVSAFNGRAAAAICRSAGARAALACLEALPRVRPATRAGSSGIPDGLAAWWRGLQRLAAEAADCVAPVAARAETLLTDQTGAVFADFVAAGLKAYGANPTRRSAFFTLEDPWALRLLARRPGVPGFDPLAGLLTAYTTAVWGDVALLRAAPGTADPNPRASLSGRVMLLPATVDADDAAGARRVYLATVAHAACHLAVTPVRHKVGQLKPMQVTLVNLIEDARVEALAMQALPGLRGLWAPFHRAAPAGPRTAPNLMARLSRSLFDPDHPDPDGFVAKGAALFAEAAPQLHDPAISLQIGRTLGHDLGQMRVQFNWRDYVIEPAYRDDGAHLWEPPDEPSSTLELMVQAAAARPDPASAPGTGGGGRGRAREAAPDDRSPTIVASYPEWDSAIGQERPDWTTIRDVPARAVNPAALRDALAGQAVLRRRVAGLIRNATIGRPARLRRQPDGDDIDMDAAIDATIALRAGEAPDGRLFQFTRPRSRDLATVMMLDTSASTAARLPDGRSVLDVQCLSVALLAEALDGRGDLFALRAFASNGRDDVQLSRIKEFGERFDEATLARLAGLRPRLSTRLGAALRHARAEFSQSRAWRRLLLVLSDGEPSDIDVTDSADLVIDARRAVLGLRHAGIDVFGIVLDPEGVGSATKIFGRSNAIAINDLAELPARLAGLYFRLARR